jgi:NifU-like protein involved in Fe-S cluster formation
MKEQSEVRMSEQRKQFLRDLGYPERAIAYIIAETNQGEILNPTVSVRHQGHCGDILLLQLLVDPDNGVIQDARYRLTGCAGLQASASAATDMVRGMRIDELQAVDVDKLVDFLGGTFPEFKLDCVELTRDTLHKAAEEYMAAQK